MTQFYLQTTPCLPFLRECSPDGTTTTTEAVDIQLQLTTHLSTPKDERLSWPGWLTYSGWFTHISGHPSATDRAQDSESRPAKDRRYTAGPRNQGRTDYGIWGHVPARSRAQVRRHSPLKMGFGAGPAEVEEFDYPIAKVASNFAHILKFRERKGRTVDRSEFTIKRCVP